jgi:hypothetical protein
MVSPKFKKDGYVLNIASFLSLDKFLRIADRDTFLFNSWDRFKVMPLGEIFL